MNVPVITNDPRERRRVEHTRLRRRLLYSEFEEDVLERMKRDIGNVRKSAWGHPDLTSNPMLSLYEQFSVQYTEDPRTLAPDGGAELLEAVAASGFWALMQRVQRDTLGLREMLVRIDVDGETGAPVYTPVFPDLVQARARPRALNTPVFLRHVAEEPGIGWCTHELSVEDPDAPYYRVYSSSGSSQQDVTVEVLGERFEGESYPFRWKDGTPFINYVVYHAAETGCLWDPFTGAEIVEGAINICVLLTFYRHCVRNAAWAQRYAVGARPVGAEIVEDDSLQTRQEMVSDPATVAMFEPAEGPDGQETQPVIGQWSSPIDPEAILRSIRNYEDRILELARARAGASRTEPDIRSGYSLAVERESVRQLQVAFEPQFRRGDLAVLAMTAALRGRGEPMDGYRLQYYQLPRSAAEIRAEREELEGRQKAGLLSRVQVYQRMHPQVTRDEAILALAQVQADEADVVEAAETLMGKVATPPAVALNGAQISEARALVEGATAGVLEIDTCRAMLTRVVGLPDTAASEIALTIKVRTPPTPAPTS